MFFDKEGLIKAVKMTKEGVNRRLLKKLT